MDIHITRHSIKRGRKRLGVPKSALIRNAHKAFKYGKRPTDFSGIFKQYLINVEIKQAHVARVYDVYVYVFGQDSALVTCFRVPNEFIKDVRKVKR